MRKRLRFALTAAAAAMFLLSTGCVPPISAITQIKSLVGCIAENRYGGLCRTGRALDDAKAVATPNGVHFYVAGLDGIAIIHRDKKTGDLSQPAGTTGCVNMDGSTGCQNARALTDPTSIVALKDAVFVAGVDQVAYFRRDPKTGALSQDPGTTGCISVSTTDGEGGDCALGRALNGGDAMSIYKDTLAVASSGGVALLKRDKATGALTQPAGPNGCANQSGSDSCLNGRSLAAAAGVALTPSVIYVTSSTGGSVAVLTRSKTGDLAQDPGVNGCISENGTDNDGGLCVLGRALDTPEGIVALGNSVLVAADDSEALSQFTRDPKSGALAQGAGGLGCISETGQSIPSDPLTAGQCADGRALSQPVELAVRKSTVFVGSNLGPSGNGGLAAIERDKKTGALSQLPGTAGCIQEEGDDGCADGYAIDDVNGIAAPKKGPIFTTTPGGDATGFGGGRSYGALTALDRDKNTGAFTQGVEGDAGCVSETGRSSASDPTTAGSCINGIALDGARGVAVSGDGKNVYVVSENSGVAVLSRDADTGALVQLPGDDACISDLGGDCADGRALSEASDIALSPDGNHAYVASTGSDAVAVFVRDPATGALSQPLGLDGCVSDTGAEGCSDGSALADPRSVAVSPEGTHVYVASSVSDSVAAFSRDATTGALTQLAATSGCISETGTGGTCTDGKALDGATDLALSADGTFVYVTSPGSQAVAILFRNTGAGFLINLPDPNGCVSETGQSVPSEVATAGQCINGVELDLPTSVATLGDDSIYVRGSLDAMVVLRRDTSTDTFSQLGAPEGCLSEDGSGGGCKNVSAVSGIGEIAVTDAAQNSVYLASNVTDAVAAFDRNDASGNGELTQVTDTFGCVADEGYEDCAVGKALDGASAVAVSPDNRHVYVTSAIDDAVAVFARSNG